MGDQEASRDAANQYEEAKKAHREMLVQGVYDQQRGFDKAILTLTSGAFALSLLFMEKVCPEPVPSSIAYIVWSWAFLALGMLATLISFLTSQAAHRCAITDLDEKRPASPRRQYLGMATTFLNLAAIVLFVLGLLGIIIFAAMNMTPRPQ